MNKSNLVTRLLSLSETFHRLAFKVLLQKCRKSYACYVSPLRKEIYKYLSSSAALKDFNTGGQQEVIDSCEMLVNNHRRHVQYMNELARQAFFTDRPW